MATTLLSVNPPAIQEEEDNTAALHIYWRKPDGWISTGLGAGAGAQYLSSIREGMMPLPEFGSFIMSELSKDRNGVNWNAYREPWRLILQHPDGPRAFPLEQILAYNWDIAPVYRDVTFPQLEGVEVPVYECPECERAILRRPYDLATHLKNGHGWSRSEITQYGRDAEINFTRPRREPRATRPYVPAPITLNAESGGVIRDPAFACTVCGWMAIKGGFASANLATHMRTKHGAKVAAKKNRRAPKKGATNGNHANDGQVQE